MLGPPGPSCFPIKSETVTLGCETSNPGCETVDPGGEDFRSKNVAGVCGGRAFFTVRGTSLSNAMSKQTKFPEPIKALMNVRRSSRLTYGYPVNCYLQSKKPLATDALTKKKVKASLMVLETGVSDGSSSKLFRCFSLDSGYSDFFKGSDLEYPDFLKEDWIQVYTKGAGYTSFS